jgi:hypothetical protein
MLIGPGSGSQAYVSINTRKYVCGLNYTSIGLSSKTEHENLSQLYREI